MTAQDSSSSRLIDAAVNLLESDGLSRVTVRNVARAAGMSHGAPRRYFPTLHSIHAEVARRGFVDMRDRIEATVGGDVRPRSRVRAAALEYVRFAVDRPEMFALMFRHDVLESSGAHLRGTSLPLFAFVTALIRPLAGHDSDVRAVQIWTAVHGIAALSSTAALGAITDVDPTDLVDAAIFSIVGTDREDGRSDD
ncbi:TetR/AcrR family transcriptional regulator [Rhodococcus sp. G-MC3]|uniref:TetR/AcrR family transcriptional regulator n=1 Tax=Rhodococcus sp. G-MC3 TaxID=3046209 RepID=UPI0024BB4759|nr:TetR/AcrR family transcriptional regulator [Rhodococcus sp. G-MC3]MDJ0391841.1 TetR/AcrR family transcriptional regulator [Rhodococcus sp. G-MC3]